MKKIRVIKRIMKDTGAENIWRGFLAFLLLCTFLIWILEPEIRTWGEAAWYCYAVVTTVGFGDIVVHRLLTRILSVLLSCYACLVIAIVTGVVVNYFTQVINLRQKGTLAAFMEKLEHLPELSHEELEEISAKVKHYLES